MKTERAIELLNRISDSQFDGIHGDERREALSMAVRALVSQQTINDSQGLVNDCISRKAVMKEFSDFVRKSNNSDFALTPTWNDAVSLVGSMPSAQPQSTMGQVNDTVQSTKDCISRQQAIDALDKHIDTFDAIDTNYLCGLRTAMSILKEMPSAQPETHDKRTETHECDLINRQQAIDATRNATFSFTIKSDIDFANYRKEIQEIFNNVIDAQEKALNELPSAQPQRKKGKWISEVKGKKAIIDEYGNVTCSAHCSECGDWLTGSDEYACRGRYCPSCGARMDGESE